MKTITSCMECLAQFGRPRFTTSELVTIPDNGVLETVCDLGHRTSSALQNEKFALLAEMAIDGIVEEHYREAIGSFAASLERLWEYGAKVICRHHGVDPTVFASAWKPVSRQSERQLGAFMVAYLITTGSRAPELNQKMVELRNRVAHDGYIPTREEAIRYGQAVADCAHPLLHLLGGQPFEETIRDVTFDLLRLRGRAARDAGHRYSTMSLATVLGVTRDEVPVSISAAVDRHAARPSLAKAMSQLLALAQTVDPGGPGTATKDQ